MSNWLARLSQVSPRNFRILMNLYPPLFGASIKVTAISQDFRNVHVILKKTFLNTNYVGTHFGGSIYAMTDPFYMLMLIKNLGSEFIVWDKAAAIDYLKPGKGKLSASFTLTAEEIEFIRKKATDEKKYIFDKTVDVMNAEGEVIARVTKTLYVKVKSER